MPLKNLELYTLILACIMGVIFHYIYDWSGKSFIAGLFFPTNESVWEHLKLIFLPIMLTAVLEYFAGNIQNPCFACIKLRSALLGMVTTIILFYTLSGIIGKNIAWLNIAIYFIAMAVAFYYSYRNLSAEVTASCNPTACIIIIFAILILFMIFSVYPPNIGLFADPQMM